MWYSLEEEVDQLLLFPWVTKGLTTLWPLWLAFLSSEFLPDSELWKRMGKCNGSVCIISKLLNYGLHLPLMKKKKKSPGPSALTAGPII